jgi:hypothetical protein
MESGVSFFLTNLPLWLSYLLIVVVPTAIAMAAQILIRRKIGAEKLAKNNEIAGFKFATVGVIYAVLLAFAVIVVWEKFGAAQDAVADEAGATAALFRYAEGKEPEALALRKGARQLSEDRDQHGLAGDGDRIGQPRGYAGT